MAPEARAPLLDPDRPWSAAVSGPTLPGVTWTPLEGHRDHRGTFTKAFQRSAVLADGGEGQVAEVYLSTSARGVVRGLHFQAPPHDHAKTVCCTEGAVLDVVVDLRVGSPTQGAAACFRLDGAEPVRLHLPPGVAHGFQALSPTATMVYVVSSEHAPDHDRGVHPASVGVDWPLVPLVLSDRDAAFPALAELASPFTFAGAGR